MGNPKSAILVGGPSQATASVGPDKSKSDAATTGGEQLGSEECGLGLAECLICLLYVEQGRARDEVKALAWRCGAATTLNPLNRAITHVLFKPITTKSVIVSVAFDEDDDHVSFVDFS